MCLGICADTCAKLSLFKQSKFSKTRNGRWIKVNITLQAQKSAHCLYIVHYIIRTGFCKWEKWEESTGIFCRTISLIVFTHGASICSNKESCPAWLSSCPRLSTIISSLLGPTNRSLQRPDSRFALSTNGFYPDFTLWAKNWVALAHDQDCSVLEPFFSRRWLHCSAANGMMVTCKKLKIACGKIWFSTVYKAEWKV